MMILQMDDDLIWNNCKLTLSANEHLMFFQMDENVVEMIHVLSCAMSV